MDMLTEKARKMLEDLSKLDKEAQDVLLREVDDAKDLI